jgi:hypothetical protein
MAQPTPEYYDYPAAADAAGLSAAQLDAVVRHFEGEYPNDLMLRELHILRACIAIARGGTTFERLLGAQARGNLA